MWDSRNQFTETLPTEEGSTISKWFTRFLGNIQQGEEKTSGSICLILKGKNNFKKKVQKQLLCFRLLSHTPSTKQHTHTRGVELGCFWTEKHKKGKRKFRRLRWMLTVADVTSHYRETAGRSAVPTASWNWFHFPDSVTRRSHMWGK